MHEYSVTRSLVDLCQEEAQRNNIDKVYRIHLKIGKFTGFSPDSILFYFDYLKPDTKCSEAEIVFDEIPIQIQCSQCGEKSAIEEPLMICPVCGSNEINVITGREFYVESIEGE
jgi:hydrogenase nickel incorporation protein HypA/HybF